MTQRIARILIRLHSRSWRERYGAECRALLLDLPAKPDVIVDCIGHALVSRLSKYSDCVLPAVAFVALLMFVGVTVHRPGDVRSNNTSGAVFHSPEAFLHNVRRTMYCYPAFIPQFKRVRCG